MAHVFQLRSDNANFEARITSGLKAPAVVGASSSPPIYEVDATAIGGNRFNFDRSSTVLRTAIYATPRLCTSRARSVHMRVKFITTGIATGLIEIGAGAGQTNLQRWTLGLTTAGTTLAILAQNEAGSTAVNNSTAWSPTADTWYDIVVMWDGVTITNGIKFWVDGVQIAQVNATTAIGTPFDSKLCNMVTIGIGHTLVSTRFVCNEVNIWDEVITPSSVTLTSGAGSLNGAARTAFVDGTAFEGGLNTDPGIANVRLNQAYRIDGAAKTGTLDLPAAADVREDTSFDNGGTTGSLIVPSAANVKLGVVFDDDTVGTLVVVQDAVTLEITNPDNEDGGSTRLNIIQTEAKTYAFTMQQGDDPYDLTGATEITVKFPGSTHISKTLTDEDVEITDADAGQFSVTITEDDTALMLPFEDGQTIEVYVEEGAQRRIFQFANVLYVYRRAIV